MLLHFIAMFLPLNVDHWKSKKPRIVSLHALHTCSTANKLEELNVLNDKEIYFKVNPGVIRIEEKIKSFFF